jgi:hypothetical protein
VVIDAMITVDSGAAEAVALLSNGGANCIAVGMITLIANDIPQQLFVHYEYQPGAVTPITFAVKVANNDGSSLYVNGKSSGRLFGGVLNSWLKIREFIP